MATSDEIKIVIARLESMPENLKVSVGSYGALGKWELIEHVKSRDEVGELIVNVFMNGMRSYKRELMQDARQ